MNQQRVKILFAVPRFSVGGAEKLLVHQLRALDRTRLAPTLITLFEEQEHTLAGQVTIDQCFGFRGTLDIWRLPVLTRYLRQEHFDIVVTHLFSANLLVRIAAILAPLPFILTS